MTIAITLNQIPQLWEIIKFSAVNADLIKEENLQDYLNRLLYNLLAGKYQCFVRYDEQRVVQAIAITSVLVDSVSGTKTLHINCLYSFNKVSDQTWNDDMEVLKAYALKQGCTSITANAMSDKAAHVCEAGGMTELSKVYSLNLKET